MTATTDQETEEMAKKEESRLPEGKTKRFELLLTAEAEEVLDQFGLRGKADFVNKAIVEYWKLSEGQTMPLVSKDTVEKLSKRLAKQLREDLEIS